MSIIQKRREGIMPVTLELAEDGYVLHYAIVDPWEVSELLELYKKEREYRDSTPHIMHSFTDFSRARRIPKSWWSLKNGPGLTHPRGGEMVFFGLGPGISIIVETILKLTRYKRVKIFTKIQEAQEYTRKLAAKTKAESEAAVANSGKQA
jgi:hypothetical protein